LTQSAGNQKSLFATKSWQNATHEIQQIKKSLTIQFKAAPFYISLAILLKNVAQRDKYHLGNDINICLADISRRNLGASEPLTTRHIWHVIKTRGRLAGVGKLAPHDLRRTAITKAFQ